MNEYDHDMITRYLDGEMNADEAAAFREMMQQDPGLAREVELYRELNETLKMKLHPDADELAFRKTLEGMRTAYFSGNKENIQQPAQIVRLKRTRWITAIAAVFTGIILLTGWSPW
jgi:anti-sigma factor RsiW